MLSEARVKARMTREEAAYKLYIAVRTLYSYEKGHRVPPPEVIRSMASLYSNKQILGWYCSERCPIGARCSESIGVA
jgi:DNA-binding XRE family transcriptional regulator